MAFVCESREGPRYQTRKTSRVGLQVKRRLEVEAENPQEPKDGGGAIKEDEPVGVVALSFVKEKSPTTSPIGRKPMVMRSHLDTSLGSLTRKFAELLKSSADGTVDLNYASQMLNVPKRRVYDVTNVLEGAQVIKKKYKNYVQWFGDLHPGPIAQELRELQEKERKLDELIQICTWHIHQMCENQHTRKFAYLTYEDVQRIPSLKEQTVIVIQAPAETKLEVPHPEESFQVHLSSTKGPIEVFVCSDQPFPDSCVSNGSHNVSTDGYHSPPQPLAPLFRVHTKDNHTSDVKAQQTQHTPAPASSPSQCLAEDQHSFLNLTPLLNLSADGEEYLLSLAEDEGITDLFSSVDLEQLPLDLPF